MSAAQQPGLSIVVPAYNESGRIGRTLQEILRVVDEHGWQAELLLVNDGSRDNTQQILEQWAQRDSRIRVLQATQPVVMFTDADLSAPMEEATRLLAALDSGADIAIGSRWLVRDR